MAKTYTREGFVKEYGPYISVATRGTGILPGTLIAQAIIESQGKLITTLELSVMVGVERSLI